MLPLDGASVEEDTRTARTATTAELEEGLARRYDVVDVLVVDDDTGFRASVVALLQQAGYVTLEAADAEEALRLARRARPALVLLDFNLPGVCGHEVCRQLRDEFGQDLAIAFLSGEKTEPLDRAAGLLVGADDYLVKPVDPNELLARVRALLRRVRRVGHEPGDFSLTSRELEILRLLADGVDQRQIARRLEVSPKTVGGHIEHILAKLGVHSRAQAVALAYRSGITRDAH